jgi:two-component system, CitB family, sensor kinase
MRLRPRIVLGTMTLVTVIVGLTGGLFLYLLRDKLYTQIGENALDVARTVARMPDVHEAFASPDPSARLQPLAETLRVATGASYIVIGDQHGLRYAHPSPDRIGKPMVGGDNDGALVEGREYVSVATGSLGRAMRGKVPVLDEQHQIIGVVSVGFLLTEVDRSLRRHVRDVILVLLVGWAIAIPGAMVVAGKIKGMIHGLEPEEIAATVEQRNAILQTIREGIIAVDADGRIVVANSAARELVPGLAPGLPILDILPNSRLMEVLRSGEPEFDQHMLLGETTVLTNRFPIRIDGTTVGGVASFRDRSELERVYRELSDTRRYTDELRAQAHEFANTLQAVSGMLQLGQVDDAVDFIQDVSQEHRDLVEALPRSIAEPAVAALLLGKRARAEERHCRFVIDPASRLDGRLPDATVLVRVIGNLVDNALDAVQSAPLAERLVRVRLAAGGGQVAIEVADTGPGVPPALAELIFAEGFTTKAAGRGVGLALVKRIVDRSGGTITVGRAPEGGALFQVAIPSQQEV